jgi:hypothetical protein
LEELSSVSRGCLEYVTARKFINVAREKALNTSACNRFIVAKEQPGDVGARPAQS